MGKLKGKFIAVKCTKSAQKVIDANLADQNMVVVMSPMEGQTQGRKAEIRVGSAGATFFMPTGVGAVANKAQRKEIPNPNFVLTNFAASYMSVFCVCVANNGTALNFTPCSQGTGGAIFGVITFAINPEELALTTTVSKEWI